MLDDFGRIGGSNILEVQTKNAVLPKNGSFEQLENETPLFWELSSLANTPNRIFATNETSSEGLYSIRIDSDNVQADSLISQEIPGNLIAAGGEYRLLFDYKTAESFNVDIYLLEIETYNLDAQDEWTEYTFDFKIPEDFNQGTLTFRLGFHDFDIIKANIDNIRIEKLN